MRMLAWRSMIIVVSLTQVAAGVVCWSLATDPETGPEIGRFGLAACLVVGGLGLVGQGATFLRPVAIARSGVSLGEDGLRTFLKDRVARFKLPRDFIFVPELPRYALGKVVKKNLSRV
jgi:acyl-CoA synthetase (AMP-forming)/AMP-acid ligase II